ncbi:MAG TPA: hypothetical protein DD729_05315 [Rhodobacteraceae bacterium]|jgi:hypothetical protein|nr:hypothetical protein [Paracoccaceae bacterium]
MKQKPDNQSRTPQAGNQSKVQKQSDREKRLKATMKENMKRRKAQIRARKAPTGKQEKAE